MENNRDALLTPAVQDLLKTKREKIDVLIVMPSFGNEAGYYVAHKLNASLVLLTTVSYTLPELSWAVGDPYNPAFTPNIMLGFSQNMNFQALSANMTLDWFPGPLLSDRRPLGVIGEIWPAQG